MNQRTSFGVARHLLVTLVAVFTLARPAAADTARLRVSPQIIQVNDRETTVEVTLDGVSDLYGLDIRLAFDPALIEIVDADDAKDGVQISPGQIPSPDFVVRNEADNAAGSVWYAVTQLNPREPASGSGVVCAFGVRGRASGSAEMRIVEAKLVDRTGGDLAAETFGGDVTVTLGAAPASGSTPEPTPTETPRPTDTPTDTPASTEEPTATPKQEKAESTATPEPEDADPTATPEPKTPPTAEPEPTITPTAAPPTPPEPARAGETPYPAPTEGPTGAGATATPSPSAEPTAPAPAEDAEPTPTATEVALVAPPPAALDAAAPGDAGSAVDESHTVGEAEVNPLISPRVFAILLGLVAAAALALAVYLTRDDAQAPQRGVDRKAP